MIAYSQHSIVQVVTQKQCHLNDTKYCYFQGTVYQYLDDGATMSDVRSWIDTLEHFGTALSVLFKLYRFREDKIDG